MADNLGDDMFLDYVAQELCVNPLKLSMASNVKKVVCDRYRLKSVVKKLKFSHDNCIVCKDVLVDLDRYDSSKCCGSLMHIMCMQYVKVCPTCGDG